MGPDLTNISLLIAPERGSLTCGGRSGYICPDHA